MNLINGLLGLLLPSLDAGACDVLHGQNCNCKKHKQWVINCAGVCAKTNRAC